MLTKDLSKRSYATTSKKDNTKYQFNGRIFKKGPFAHAIVKHIVDEKGLTLNEIITTFSKDLHGYLDVAVPFTGLENDEERKRYFVNHNKLIVTKDYKLVTVTNQWGIGNIHNIVKLARKNGLTVIEIPEVK